MQAVISWRCMHIDDGFPNLTEIYRGLTEKALQTAIWRIRYGYPGGQKRKEMSRQNEKHKKWIEWLNKSWFVWVTVNTVQYYLNIALERNWGAGRGPDYGAMWNNQDLSRQQMNMYRVYSKINQYSSVQLLSRVWLFVTPWSAACQASLSITNSRSPPKPMSIVSVMPSNHLLLCRPFSSCPQSFPASESFQMSQLSTSGGQSIGVSASTSVPPMNTQDWSPLGWTGWISLQSKGLSRVF